MNQISKYQYERDMFFFDLEFFVPKKDRDYEKYSLKANPSKKEHFLIGGVFARYNPLRISRKKVKLVNLWIWNFNNEKELLQSIYKLFKKAWKNQKKINGLELDLCGIGISKFDVPALYIRSVKNKIDSPENLFNIYFKGHQIDLSNVAIPFFDKAEIMHPISTNRFYGRFAWHKEKLTGMNVWEMFDLEEYDKIQRRTEGEIRDLLKMYDKLMQFIKEKKR